MAFAAGYSAGLQTPGRFSSLGQALQQLLAMGFQTSERKGAEAHAAGQAEVARGGAMEMQKLRGGQELEQIGATGEQGRMTAVTTGEQQRLRDRQKTDAEKQSLLNFMAAGMDVSPDAAVAAMKYGIKDMNGNGRIDPAEAQAQGGNPAAAAPGREPLGGAPEAPPSPATPPGGTAPGFGNWFRGRLATPQGAAAFAGLEPSMQSGLKTAAEAGETSDIGILAQRAQTDPDAALRLDKTLSAQVQAKVKEDNARFNSIKGVTERATAMQEDVDQARQAYQGVLEGKLDMMVAMLGDKLPPGLMSGDPESKALAIRLAKEAYLSKASSYNAYLKKHSLGDFAEAGEGAAPGKTFDRLIRKGGKTYRLFTDGSTELEK